jgi:hypothetical protein
MLNLFWRMSIGYELPARPAGGRVSSHKSLLTACGSCLKAGSLRGLFIVSKTLLLAIMAVACSTKPAPLVIGLDGREFFEPVRSADQQSLLDMNLEEVKRNFKEDPL